MHSEHSESIYPRIILGLDVSTACIGISILKDTGSDKPEILYLGHKILKISSKIKGLEALFLRKKLFEEVLIDSIIPRYKITDIVIEEPLLSSNNSYTVASLLRFNGMIAEGVYRILGIVPSFISSYDARMFSFPELASLRKYNRKGEVYSENLLKSAIKKDNIVLFGSYPFDVDKKMIMMNMVNEKYADSNINWVMDKKGELKKENYDACDSLICALAYVNINHHGIEKPKILESEWIVEDNITKIKYKTKIWDKVYDKTLSLD